MSNISISKIGVTKLDVDAVVNAANSGLWEGGGVCGAIFKEAGSKELTDACNKIGHCDVGNAVITPGFNLAAKYIIHAVGPQWIDGEHGEPSQLYDAYKNSLLLAKENGCHSIGFPLISAGIFGYPKDGAWRKAIRASVNFIMKNPDYDMDIVFAILDDSIIEKGEKILADIVNETGVVLKTNDAKKTQFIKQSKESTLNLVHTSTAIERIAVFEDTMNWVKNDSDLADSIVEAKKKTKIFWEDDYPVFECDELYDTEITVSKDRSYEAAMKLKKSMPDSKIAVMNFANAFHAGGGVTKGSSAQEECLCRTSTLYPLLYRRSLRDTFYKHHHTLNTSKASDALIYTEGVIICKTDEDLPKRMPKEDWVSVDVITVAAPDLRTKSNIHAALVGNGTYMNDAELFGYHVKRAIHILTCAAAKGADTLVLGAFGCGAFQNNPEVVAHAYKIALAEFPKVFKRIEFAVYCSPKDQTNYDIFSKMFG